jgi:hypothetical protein
VSEETRDLYASIAQSLALCLPETWTKAVIEARIHDGTLELSAHYRDQSLGAEPYLIADFGRAALFIRLREIMSPATPWHHATFTLFPNGLFDCVFGYDRAVLAE